MSGILSKNPVSLMLFISRLELRMDVQDKIEELNLPTHMYSSVILDLYNLEEQFFDNLVTFWNHEFQALTEVENNEVSGEKN